IRRSAWRRYPAWAHAFDVIPSAIQQQSIGVVVAILRIAVAMVTVTIAEMPPHIDPRQHDTDLLAEIAHPLQRIDGDFAARPLPLHEKDDVVGEAGRDEGIGNRYERRRVEDDEIELLGQAFHEGLHDIGIEDLYRVRRIAPCRNIIDSAAFVAS